MHNKIPPPYYLQQHEITKSQLTNFSQMPNAAESLQMTMNPYLMGGSSISSNKPLMVFTGTDPEYSDPSISYPANLQGNLPIIPLFTFPPPQSPHDNTSSSMDSKTNSNTTVNNTFSQFNNSDLEIPDEFDNSEAIPSTFSQPPFQPLHSQIKFEPPSLPSSISNVTPTFSPLTSEHSDNNSSVITQISQELDNFITL